MTITIHKTQKLRVFGLGFGSGLWVAHFFWGWVGFGFVNPTRTQRLFFLG